MSDALPQHDRVTRLAPSPTGALHLGNARTFLVNWALARRAGWRIVLRIEDLDGPRVKPGATDAVIDTLRWLGIDWDEGPIVQSHDLAPYAAAMQALAARGLVYPCELSRAEIEASASAPQDGGPAEVRFPPELRPPSFPTAFDNPATSWRFIVPDRAVTVNDRFRGTSRIRPLDTVGDFVVWTKRSQPSYQLAVVVDDIRHRVTDVVRGDDLLDSAARQTLLYEALDATRIPSWCHLPLVVGSDGRRLAKRHGDTRVATYRDAGVAPERVVGLIAHWCGAAPEPAPMDAREFAQRFNLATMPREQIVFSQEHDRWLQAGIKGR